MLTPVPFLQLCQVAPPFLGYHKVRPSDLAMYLLPLSQVPISRLGAELLPLHHPQSPPRQRTGTGPCTHSESLGRLPWQQDTSYSEAIPAHRLLPTLTGPALGLSHMTLHLFPRATLTQDCRPVASNDRTDSLWRPAV